MWGEIVPLWKQSAQAADHEELPKHFPQVHQQKNMVIVFWNLTRAWNLLQLDKMHIQLSKTLANSARPHVPRMILQKLNELKYETLPHPQYSLISHLLITTCSSILKIFKLKYIPLWRKCRKFIRRFLDVQTISFIVKA